jgi:glycosyltransferase involved in cell wall biosynthesis
VIVLLTVHHRNFQLSESRSRLSSKDGLRSPHLQGAAISALRQMKALSSAPFVDRLILYAPSPVRATAAEAVRTSPFAGRVEVLDEVDIRAGLGPRDPVILVQFGPDLLGPQIVRWVSGNRKWPICGFTYSISPTGVFHELALAALSGFERYDSIFCCSRSVRESMSRVLQSLSDRVPGLTPPRLPVIPLGVRAADFRPLRKSDARRALSLPEGPVVFLFLGRIDPRYKANLQPLLTAFSRLDKTQGPLLVVAGAKADPNGDEILDRLRFRCAELGITNRVRWLTNVSAEVRRKLLSAADVFVSPADNLQESFGLAVVEAMCARLPAIASDWNGYRDLVVPGQTGLLVPTRLPEDITALSRRAALVNEFDFHWEAAEATVVDVSALEQAMSRLAGDAGMREKMGRAGQRRAVAEFDWERVLALSREEWEAQLAAARRTRRSPRAPLAMDHGKVFAKYATTRLSSRTLLRRTPEASTPSIVLSLPPRFLSEKILVEILETAGEAIALGRLPRDPGTAARHAAYLLKHGFLEIVDDERGASRVRARHPAR